jgi:putative ABC transport system permease protein
LADQALTLTSLKEMDRAEIYWVLFAAALILYTIACLNAVNLMAIRLMTRRRELCIRFAIGGARRKILQLILIESLVLSLAAGLLVAIAARWVFPGFLAALNGSDEALYQSYWDAKTLSFIGGLGAIACIAIMIAPAARLWRDDFPLGLKEGGAGSGGSRRGGRVRLALIVLQAACAVVLLTATGLMVRSFQRVHHVDLGFDPAGMVKVWVLFPHGYEPKPEARLQLFERLKRRLRFVPGVEAVSYAQDSILEGGIWGTAQLQMADGSFQPTAGNYISADYLQTAGLTMKRGRWLSNEPGRVEVVINETLARARFGDENPIGKFIKIQITGDRPFPVVGVVKNVRETLRSPAGMRFYSQAWQYPPNINTLVLRLAQDPGPGFADAVRQAIREVDPNLIASDIRSIDQLVTDLMWTENYAYRILKGLAAIALGLTAVGLFSVITYSVGSRMNEFGVRLAVGAKPSDLGRLVMGRGLAAAGIGLAAGLAGAFGLTRFMAGLLFETTPFDPQVYLVVIAVLMAAAAMACWMPARRAARLDVARLLRSD